MRIVYYAPIMASHPLLTLIETKVRNRDMHLAAAAQIDRELADAAKVLGVSLEELGVAPSASVQAKADGRRAGSMTEFIVEYLGQADRGVSRLDLKAILKSHPKFGEQVTRNENGFYNGVNRCLRRGEIVQDPNGILYLHGRLPDTAKAVEESQHSKPSLFEMVTRSETPQ
ncbi:MAG: hypothetical protein JWR84_1093 [Caulobacter sp.]|nr:hypothetical protein [Caulobacter sp.]